MRGLMRLRPAMLAPVWWLSALWRLGPGVLGAGFGWRGSDRQRPGHRVRHWRWPGSVRREAGGGHARPRGRDSRAELARLRASPPVLRPDERSSRMAPSLLAGSSDASSEPLSSVAPVNAKPEHHEVQALGGGQPRRSKGVAAILCEGCGLVREPRHRRWHARSVRPCYRLLYGAASPLAAASDSVLPLTDEATCS